jgi:hypothetical protein
MSSDPLAELIDSAEARIEPVAEDGERIFFWYTDPSNRWSTDNSTLRTG